MNKNELKKLHIERLPESELEVMKLIWNAQEPIGTGKMIEILSKEKNWSRSTVQVLLSRLEEREFVICQREGRIKLYTAKIKEEEYCKKEAKSFMETLFHNSSKKLIASLVESKAITKADIDDIVKIINEGEGKDDSVI